LLPSASLRRSSKKLEESQKASFQSEDVRRRKKLTQRFLCLVCAKKRQQTRFFFAAKRREWNETRVLPLVSVHFAAPFPAGNPKLKRHNNAITSLGGRRKICSLSRGGKKRKRRGREREARTKNASEEGERAVQFNVFSFVALKRPEREREQRLSDD